MKVIKLDRRYAGFPKFKFALHFGKRTYEVKQRYKYCQAFRQLYGSDRWINPDRKLLGPEPMWLYSPNWREDDKHGRILFNNEADATAIALMVL